MRNHLTLDEIRGTAIEAIIETYASTTAEHDAIRAKSSDWDESLIVVDEGISLAVTDNGYSRDIATIIGQESFDAITRRLNGWAPVVAVLSLRD